MCGISGGYDVDKFVRQKNVDVMVHHQHKRGPDNKGIKTIDNVTFGHNRLSVIDLTMHGNQPAVTDRYMITYNGEWYDYKRVKPISQNDTLAILYEIHNKGIEHTLSVINGMFALAIYDSKTNEIHLAVDRMGQKPLYYYHSGVKFYFASTPAALYHLRQTWTINEEALASYWLLGGVMGNNSIFDGIKKVTASEHLTFSITTNSVKVERYWEPEFQNNTDGIEELVIDAIQITKTADVPVHIFLSGGIDSTLVASQFEGGQAIHLDSPERPYAEYVANKFNIDMKVIYPSTIETMEYLTDYSKQCGEPTMAGLIPYVTAKEVSNHGKVAISGNGADELFFGYNRTHDELTEAQMDHTYRLSAFKGGNYPFHTYFNGENNGRMWELGGYVQYDLNKTLDFASMCHGLEVRSPFLDHRLVEMALSISEKKHKENGNKTILKRMLMKMGFDANFLNRPKLGFSLHKTPEMLDKLVAQAWVWCHHYGYLDLDKKEITSRDRKYIEMSALGFYYWFKEWEHKIK